jgi:hypothetical protein
LAISIIRCRKSGAVTKIIPTGRCIYWDAIAFTRKTCLHAAAIFCAAKRLYCFPTIGPFWNSVTNTELSAPLESELDSVVDPVDSVVDSLLEDPIEVDDPFSSSP